MSLLDKASLILTPNAIAEDKLYSIIPSNGNGDMVVARATTATRVNSEGFIEEVPYNLVKYSEMFNDGFWVKNICTITPNTVIAPNGLLTADTVAVSAVGQSRIIAVPSLFNVSRYILSFYVKKNNINFNYMELGNSYATFDLSTGMLANSGVFSTGWSLISAFSESLPNGWYKLNIVSDCTISGNYQIRPFQAMSSPNVFNYPNIGDSSYIWGAQLVQGSVPKDYFPTTDRLNVPRLNYDVAGGCPSILLEPQRTNLNTNYLIQDWNLAGLVRTINYGISPENTQNSTQLVNAGLPNLATLKNYSLVSGTVYTFSLWIKKTSGVFINNQGQVYIYPQSPNVNINFSDATTSWKRYSVTFTSSTTGNVTFQIRTDVASVIEIYGVQLEVGSYPTSIIPTIASTVTRNRDAMTLNNILTNNLISNIGGTWFINQKSIEFKGSGNEYSLSVGGITTGIVFSLDTSGYIRFRTYLASVTTVNLVIPNSNVTQTKLAVSWDVNSGLLKLYFNGALVGSYTGQSFANYEVLAISDINSGGTGGSHKVDSCMLFPAILTDSECIQLTTL